MKAQTLGVKWHRYVDDTCEPIPIFNGKVGIEACEQVTWDKVLDLVGMGCFKLHLRLLYLILVLGLL
jgi:hypothetical protein